METKTQVDKARNFEITEEMEYVASQEPIELRDLRKGIAEGTIVITASKLHKKIKPIGIGKGLKTKINANIGSSGSKASLNYELSKLKTCIEAGADTVMDLSTGGNIDKIRREIIKNSTIPVGTVPIYQAVKEKNILDADENDFLKGIKKHIEDGVDFITIHSGVVKKTIPMVRKRLMGVVSRGGALLLKWMLHNRRENPIYENFDKIMKMAKKYDVTLSLGDGLRPGCLKDATDQAQLYELTILGRLVKESQKENVQVVVEGPGHIPINEIKKNIELQKRICNNAPFYVLGPIVTDIAPGYDHITSAIGGALAAYYGADFLCYVTSAEHLRLPDLNDVKEGVIAAKIAAHAADIAKIPKARVWDNKMSLARTQLDWKKMLNLSINPEKAKCIRNELKSKNSDVCSMCDGLCSVKINKEISNKKPGF